MKKYGTSFKLRHFYCLATVICFTSSSIAKLNGNNSEYLSLKNDPVGYFVKKYENNNEIILNQDKIEEFNRRIIERQTLNAIDPKAKNHNLLDYPEVVSKNLIINAVKYSDLYDAIPYEKYYNFDSLKEINSVRYAVAITKSSIRSIPTDIRFYEKDDGIKHFDLARYKEVKFGEPMVVLHETLDNTWLLVQTINTKGWIKAKDVAFTNKETFTKYLKTDDFVVVIAKNIEKNGIYMDMGVKLALDHEDSEFYYVNYPVKNQNSSLGFRVLKMEKNADLHHGYLPYTTSNLIKQVMKYYETPYGWGGIDNGVDCSGLVLNVYSVFGFVFPRNSNKQQSMAGNIFKFDGRNNKEILNNLVPGSLLFFPGHIMLYLGKVENKYYIIHSVGSIYNKNKEKIRVMTVDINDISKIFRANGKTFMKELKTATEVR